MHCWPRLFLVLSGLVLVGAVQADEKPAPRLNVVLIVADDLGWADLGCYGSKFHRTPNLDQLAKDGMRFTQGYAACPVCSPTRAALMTGKYPARLHLTDWLPGRPDRPEHRLLRPNFRQHLPLEEITLAEMFKSAGYVTAHIGKWHLGGEGFSPLDQGFAINIAGDHTGTPLSYFAPFRAGRQGSMRSMPGLEAAPEGEYLTDRYALEAEKFLDKHHDRPFFLYLPHNAVHTPLRAKKELVERYPQRVVPGQQSNATYAAMLQSLDEAVGRVLRKLEEHKLTDRTVVIFTSDNGGLATLEGPGTPATINSPLREGKGWLYEGGIRVPLMVRWPGTIKSGRVCHALAASQDLFPTLMAACKIPYTHAVDGVNLLEVWKGTTENGSESLYWHYPHYANQGSRPSAALREGNLKLIEFYENQRRELFDLAKDPGENRNLAGEQPQTVERLAKKLDDWRQAVRAQLPQPNRGYRPNPQAADGTITLPARTATVHGLQLRYEPLPHKNTLGYWVQADDHASWEFVVTRPGTFSLEVLQGCGTGQGGSLVEVRVANQRLPFEVEDTGGFQQFKRRTLGKVTLEKPGTFTLTVKPTKKAKSAVMDLREVRLVRE